MRRKVGQAKKKARARRKLEIAKKGKAATPAKPSGGKKKASAASAG